MTPSYDLLREAAQKIEDLTVESSTAAEKALVRRLRDEALASERAWRDFQKAAGAIRTEDSLNLVELHDVQTEYGPIRVGRDRDSKTYVAEHAHFAYPQRGRNERDAVGKLLGRLETRQKRIEQAINDAADLRCPELRSL